MAEYLLSQAIDREKADLARYYSTGVAAGAEVEPYATLAGLVHAGTLSRDEALDALHSAAIEKAANTTHDKPADLFAALVAAGRMEYSEAEDIVGASDLKAGLDRLDAENGRLTVRLDKAVARLRLGDTPMTEIRADLHPGLSRALALDANDVLGKHEIANLLNGKQTTGAKVSGKRESKATDKHTPLGFIDMTWNADKSFSVAWAFAPTEAERAMIWSWHREAVDASMRYVEKSIGQVKRGRYSKRTEAGHIGWLLFDHFSARPTLDIANKDKSGQRYTEHVEMPHLPGDPHLHTHAIVPNAAITDKGHVGALNLQKLNGRVIEFGTYYQATLATVARRAGAEVMLDKETGTARLVSVPNHVREAFSKRTAGAKAAAKLYAQQRGVDFDALTPAAQIAFLKAGARETRENKSGDTTDFKAWAEQASAMKWQHRSILRPEAIKPLADAEARAEIAYAAALPLLSNRLERQSVITGEDARVAALQGLIEAGITDPTDIDRVTRAFRERGVMQDGRQTALIWSADPTQRRPGPDRISITTALHEDQEREAIKLAATAHADRSGALSQSATKAAVARSGLDFTSDHGQAQLAALNKLAHGGRFGLVIGVAGSGKSALLTPLVDAWQRDGRQVHGVSLAWRQTDQLSGAGIESRIALHGFIRRGQSGKMALDRNTVVAVDEIGQVGTRQLLDLLRLQEKHGFKIVALGDEKQCAAIEAGPSIDLLRRALGPENVPEILTTIRQRSEREREIAGLFREGKAAEALEMKRADGTVRLVAGSYRDVVEEVAALWQTRREANRDNPDFKISISVPTNRDALEINLAIREKRRAAGEIGPDRVTLDAQGYRGAVKLPLAEGDHVRLFARVNGAFTDGRKGNIGSNGSVVEVRDIEPQRVLLRTAAGNDAWVKWDTLRNKESGRIMLAHGDVLSIDAVQGATSDEHINAMPAGSKAVTGLKGYVAESRHRAASFMVVAEGAERREVSERRMLNDPRPIREADIWANIARNLSRQPEKDSAVAMLERVQRLRRTAARGLQEARQKFEARRGRGEPGWTPRFAQARAAAAVQRVAEAIHAPAMAEAINRLAPTLKAAVSQRSRVREGHRPRV